VPVTPQDVHLSGTAVIGNPDQAGLQIDLAAIL
jgi:hypothetical protein